MSSDQRVKKLRGSGGYVMANIDDTLQQKGNLGGPDLFLAPMGRLQESCIMSYHCNVCEREYEGPPKISYENPNETVAENLVLVEKGQYLCTTCDSPIAEYRMFEKPQGGDEVGLAKPSPKIPQLAEMVPDTMCTSTSSADPPSAGAAKPVNSIVGMDIYDERACKLGIAGEVGVDASGALMLNIEGADGSVSSVAWGRIDKIGEIIVLGTGAASPPQGTSQSACSCGFSNKPGSKFCEQCGTAI